MKQLHHSGLPLYLDDDGVMVLKPPLNYLGFGRKSAGQMAVVLPEFTEAQRDEPAYDVYRGLSFAEDQERLAADQYQYDITIIMSGTIGTPSYLSTVSRCTAAISLTPHPGRRLP